MPPTITVSTPLTRSPMAPLYITGDKKMTDDNKIFCCCGNMVDPVDENEYARHLCTCRGE